MIDGATPLWTEQLYIDGVTYMGGLTLYRRSNSMMDGVTL